MPIVSAPGRLRRDEQQSPEVQGQPRKQSETHLTDRGGRKKRGREEMRETTYLLLPQNTQNLILKTIPYSL